MILKVNYNLFKVLIVNRSNLELSGRRTRLKKKKVAVGPFIYFFLVEEE